MELGASATGMQVSHVAACPEVAPALCEAEALPEHLHDLGLGWFRTRVGATAGLGAGLQVGFALPFDVRVADITYTTLDGAPYAPPYEDIHHRDETLLGLADGELTLARHQKLNNLVVGAGLGATLPLGRTEEDPFQAATEGEWHQHMQMGAGLPLLLVSASVVRAGEWGALGRLDARIPVAESGKGYRAPLTLSGSVGPSYRPSPRWTLAASVEGVVESAERWHGDPHGGRQAVQLGLMAERGVSKDLALYAELRAPIWERLATHEGEEDEDGQLHQRPLLGLGLSWTAR